MVREGLLALADFVWPRSTRHPRRTAAFWIAIAVAHVGLGWYLATFKPGSQWDLEETRTWFAAWNRGLNPYAAVPGIDYPPHAFIVNWWTGLGTDHAFLRLYPMINTIAVFALSVLVVRWAARLANVSMSRLEFVTFAAMFLASQGVRRSIEFGQTAPLAIALFVLAMVWAERRRWLAGCLFGVASYKLNLAAPFGLALVALGAFAPVVIGAGVAAALTLVFAVSVHASVPAVLYDWVVATARVYTGAEYISGETELRPLLTELRLGPATVEWLYPLLAGMLLCVLVPLVLRRGNAGPRARAIVVMASLLGWMLAAPHQIYNTVLVIPAVWLLHWDGRRLIRTPWLRRVLPAALLIPLVVNFPMPIDLWIADAAVSLPGGAGHAADLLVRALDRQGIRLVVMVIFGLLMRDLVQPAPADDVT